MEDLGGSPEPQEQFGLELTVEVVSAYVSNNPVPATELAALIATVSAAINRLSASTPASGEKPVPAVPIKKSVTHDYIISLEDGKKFKTLKRPLMMRYGMTPDEYRAKWNLPLTIQWSRPDIRRGGQSSPSRLASVANLRRRRSVRERRPPRLAGYRISPYRKRWLRPHAGGACRPRHDDHRNERWGSAP